jgi:hypothetical protein
LVKSWIGNEIAEYVLGFLRGDYAIEVTLNFVAKAISK